MDIITLSHKHTKTYIIKKQDKCLMFDAGWTTSYNDYLSIMKENFIKLTDIEYLAVSHFHIDHAGLVQVLKNYGVKFLVLESQLSGIKQINAFFNKKPDKKYVTIKETGNIIVNPKQSRDLLKKLGFDGELIETKHHSLDSATLILDNQFAFIGDLSPFEYTEFASCDDTLKDNWRDIMEYNVKTIYPAHAPTFSLLNK